ncbi:MAG: GNAT family N-acetyltransferase [Desulfobacterales bacterium]|nr:MAG: GNAT family N-acetyltransferase [Desulfobacterales bacterium]
MPDMLIKLYDLEDDWSFMAKQKERGTTIRKPIGPEVDFIVSWVSDQFGAGWAAETDLAMSNRPRSCFAAVKDSMIIGFACYDATALGFFGPIGVAPSHRRKGTGTALMTACLLDMKLKGYGYAVVGGVTDTEYYIKTAQAVEIPDSTPGIYGKKLKIED